MPTVDTLRRVTERLTDRDEVARPIFEDGRPVAWDYSPQGIDAIESTATYHYSDAGFRARVRDDLAQSSVDTVTRTIDTAMEIHTHRPEVG